jgi:hypothetical protein
MIIFRQLSLSSSRFNASAFCGAEGTRTPDLLLAKEAFSQLNYGPSASLEQLMVTI